MVGILYFLILILFLGVQLYLWWITRQHFKSERNTPVTKPNSDYDEFRSVSILIPVRNEEGNIGACLESLICQDYPMTQLQFILINDHSTDRTADLANEFKEVEVLHQVDGISGKKAAIQKGIAFATGEVIMTIDGDCMVGENWVTSMVRNLANSSNVLVTGPVWMTPDKSTFLQKYQEMEQASLNVLTCSGLKSGFLLSANGANMAYPRSLYLSLDPYSDNHQTPSGDDVFFAQKVYQNGGEVRFASQQEAIAYTNPVPELTDFIRQRVRWSAKSSGYAHGPTKLYLAGFAAVNLSVVFLLIAGIWYPFYYTYLFYGLVLKFIVDYLIIHTGMRFGNRPVCWQDALKSSLFQVFYVVYILVLIIAGKEGLWKGR